MQPGKAPALKRSTRRFADIGEGDLMFIPTPEVVERYLAAIPRGETRSLSDLRQDLAATAGADKTCPVTTGIFLRIVAEAAWDDHLAGAPLKKIVPFWRAVDPASPTAKKLRCGPDFLRTQRTAEAKQAT
jgi:hypothetical protein